MLKLIARQSCGNHGNPGGEVPVVDVNVLHAAAAQLQGVTGTEPGVQGGAETLSEGLLAAEKNACR